MHQLMPTCMEKFLRQHLPDAPMHVIQEATARDIRSKHFSCYSMLWSFHALFGQPLRASVSLYGFTRCLAGGGRANTDNRAATLMPMPPACTYDICITTNTKVAVPSLEAVPAKSRPVKSIDGDHHVQSHKHSVHLGHCFASGLSYFLHDLQQRLGSWQYLPEES